MGVEPTPPDPQSGALTVELRPPSSSVFRRCGPAGTLRPWARGRVCPPASGLGAPPALLTANFPRESSHSPPARVGKRESPRLRLARAGQWRRSHGSVCLHAFSGARHVPPALLVPVPPLPALPAETADPPADAEPHDAADVYLIRLDRTGRSRQGGSGSLRRIRPRGVHQPVARIAGGERHCDFFRSSLSACLHGPRALHDSRFSAAGSGFHGGSGLARPSSPLGGATRHRENRQERPSMVLPAIQRPEDTD